MGAKNLKNYQNPVNEQLMFSFTLSDLLREILLSIATSRGFPAELGKHPSNINTRKENGGAHGHNASESHKLITLNVL